MRMHWEFFSVRNKQVIFAKLNKLYDFFPKTQPCTQCTHRIFFDGEIFVQKILTARGKTSNVRSAWFVYLFSLLLIYSCLVNAKQNRMVWKNTQYTTNWSYCHRFFSDAVYYSLSSTSYMEFVYYLIFPLITLYE